MEQGLTFETLFLVIFLSSFPDLVHGAIRICERRVTGTHQHVPAREARKRFIHNMAIQTSSTKQRPPRTTLAIAESWDVPGQLSWLCSQAHRISLSWHQQHVLLHTSAYSCIRMATRFWADHANAETARGLSEGLQDSGFAMRWLYLPMYVPLRMNPKSSLNSRG